jgi:hypothetical protein
MVQNFMVHEGMHLPNQLKEAKAEQSQMKKITLL